MLLQKRQKDADAAAAADASAAPGASASGAQVAATALLDVASLEGKASDASAIIGKEWSKESLEKRVKEELASRGRKGVDPRVLSARLTALADVSIKFGPQTSIPVLMHAVSARFDTAKGLDQFLERSAWKRTARDLGAIVGMLEANPALRMVSRSQSHACTRRLLVPPLLPSHLSFHPIPFHPISLASFVSIIVLLYLQAPVRAEDVEHLAATASAASQAAKKKAAPISGPGGEEAAAAPAAAPAVVSADPATVVRVMGDLSILIERLHNDYVTSLQHTDPHKSEYLLRIADEQSVAVLAERAFDYYRRVSQEEGAKAKTMAAPSPSSASNDPTLHPRNLAATATDASARLAILRVEHLHYKHDSVAAQLRIVSAAAEKRAEVAAIAASAAAQAMAEARSQALEAHKAAVAAQAANANADAQQQQQQQQAPSSPSKQQQQQKENANANATNPDALLLAAADAQAVGDAASKLATEFAVQRGKASLAVAAGVVAKALVHNLSAREGSLLSAGAVALSRSPAELDLFADSEALPALQQAEAAGVDLGELSTAVVAQQAGIAAGTFDSGALMAELASFVYSNGDVRTKTRALLYHVYHHALHDRYSAGKDLLLMSKLQESIQHTDVKVQIAYNRALVQLGIAAFRLGMWQEAHECLNDICGSGHARELLAQGLSQSRLPHNSQDRDELLDKEERRRLVPFHQHISTDLAEACALTAAMLLETPNIAAAEHDVEGRRKEISRAYRRHLDAIDAKTFLGPPESTRDCIMLAGLALSECDWKRCLTLLNNVKAWGLWANKGGDKIKATLEQAVKAAALTTFLHTFSVHYDTLSLSSLETQFELPTKTVGSTVARMIYYGDLQGRLDETTQSIVLQRTPPTKLQGLALEFADRVCDVAEANERAFAVRTGQDRWGGREDGGFGGGARFGGNDGRYRRGERSGGFDGERRGGYGRGGAPRPFAAGRGGRGGGGRR